MSYGLDKNTVALLHFNNKFKDECGNLWTPDANANNTGPGKFGKNSLAGGAVSTPILGNLTFGSHDFTIDWWEYRLRLHAYDYACGMGADLYKQCSICAQLTDGDATLRTYVGNNGSSWNILNSFVMGTASLNTFVHRALVRNGNTFYSFQGGKKISTVSSSGDFTFRTNDILWVQSFSNYIDEFRVSNIARWVNDFTVPNFQYVDYDSLSYKDKLDYFYGYK